MFKFTINILNPIKNTRLFKRGVSAQGRKEIVEPPWQLGLHFRRVEKQAKACHQAGDNIVLF